MYRKQWILQDSEKGGEGSGGGGGDASPTETPGLAPAAEGSSPPSPVAPGAAPAEPNAQAPAAGEKPKSAMATALEDVEAKFYHSPEKHRVLKEDGSLDVEATLANTAKAYGSLEKQMGAAKGAPPNAPGDYKIEAPEALKDLFQPEDPGFQSFLTDAHKAGMSQHQVDTVMKAYFDWAPKLVNGTAEVSRDDCISELNGRWTDPKERVANFKSADRALHAFGGEGYQDLEAEFGNNPRFIALMAEIGKQLREDSPPSGGSSAAAGRDMNAIAKDLASKDPVVRQAAELEMGRYSEARAKEIGPIRP